MKKGLMWLILAVFFAGSYGCATLGTSAVVGAGIGAAAGAAIGGVIGGPQEFNGEGAGVGMVAGAVVGTAVGDYLFARKTNKELRFKVGELEKMVNGLEAENSGLKEELKTAMAKTVVPEAEAMATPPEKPKPIVIYRNQVLKEFGPVYFKFDRYNFSFGDLKINIEDERWLVQNIEDLVLILVGHADERGSWEYNLKLSERRAQEVKRALSKIYKIHPGRIYIAGWSEDKPVNAESNEVAWSRNRRVEIFVIKHWEKEKREEGKPN